VAREVGFKPTTLGLENLMDKQFGNGEDVRDRHYKNVAKMTIADAKKYWAC